MFTSWRGFAEYPPPAQEVIDTFDYTGPDVLPPGGERFRFNAWLFGGVTPRSGVGDELVVRAFRFER